MKKGLTQHELAAHVGTSQAVIQRIETGKCRHPRIIEELGGVRNGGTGPDSTVYYEVVPKDAFEKILWIDSDRLGFMINTVTEAALEREKQVVKNEKRERVDNALRAERALPQAMGGGAESLAE